MKFERTKNATRNILFGSVLKIYQMFIPFLMRTAMIYFMGVQYLGLNSLFTSVLQVLNLAESGIGTAMVFSMYKPIVEDDKDTLCALMRLYRNYYRIIGLVIGIVGVWITPFVPRLISGAVPNELNVYVLYLLNLAATVLSYWLFAYTNSLLVAHQRTDISSIVMIITNTLQYGIQLGVILVLKNYYLYVAAILVTQLLNNVITAVIVKRMYPQYKPVGDLDKCQKKELNGRIRDLFISKVGGVVLGSMDTIVISAFLGLTVLAIYQNYFFILSSVYGLVEIILISITAGIGNSLATETKEKNYNDMKIITFMYMWLIGFCICCFLGLFQTFMEIWVGKNLLFSYDVVVCFCVYFYVYELTRLFNVFKTAAGVWHEDRLRPLISSIVNLTLNLLTVKKLGVYGIILSTIIALAGVEIPWLLQNIFTLMYNRKLFRNYFKDLSIYFSGIIVACVLTGSVTKLVSDGSWGAFLICLIVSCVIPNVVFFCFYHGKQEFRQSVQMIDRMTKGKLHLELMLFK